MMGEKRIDYGVNKTEGNKEGRRGLDMGGQD